MSGADLARRAARLTLPPPLRRRLGSALERRGMIEGDPFYGPAAAIDPSALDALRDASEDALGDPVALAELLPRLGLNDEQLEHFPEDLHGYAGRGVLHWQYPIQFAPYLIELGRRDVRSYLEIGTRHGGTFAVTTEYLRRTGGLDRALGVDILPTPSFDAWARTIPGLETATADSRSEAFASLVADRGPFDLALIDGDHEYDGVKADFLLLKDHARLLAFHDIVNDLVPGVGRLWAEIRDGMRDEYETVEFTAQYPDVRSATGLQLLGLGLAIPRDGQAASNPK